MPLILSREFMTILEIWFLVRKIELYQKARGGNEFRHFLSTIPIWRSTCRQIEPVHWRGGILSFPRSLLRLPRR